MADGRHFENCYIAIFQWKIIGFWWNFVHSSRFWTGWTSRDQKWKSCIGQTPSSTECISCYLIQFFVIMIVTWCCSSVKDFRICFHVFRFYAMCRLCSICSVVVVVAVDLYALYNCVQNLGGYDNVSTYVIHMLYEQHFVPADRHDHCFSYGKQLQCYETVGWLIWPITSSRKWQLMCRMEC